MTDIRVIGIGSEAGGDDAVGLHVLQYLKQVPLPGIDLVAVTEPSRLMWLLEGAEHVIVVDAVTGSIQPGQVVWLSPERLATGDLTPVSSHGVEVAAAIQLARDLLADGSSRLSILGIGITPPAGPSVELSPAIQVAAGRAACEIGKKIYALRRVEPTARAGGPIE